MFTLLSERTDEIRRFRAAPWQFQHTFRTPLKDLKRFVSVFLAPFSIDEGVISTDEVVFEPRNLIKVLTEKSIAIDNRYRFTIEATTSQEVAILLETVLSDWIDFIFLPKPKAFAIYADHDEYTTFYTPRRGALSRLGTNLERAGFESVPDYRRRSSGSKWR